MRDALRAAVKEAASSAAQKSSAAGAQSPQGSTLLWSLLRTSLKQHGEALLDLQSCKSAAKEAHREVHVAPKCDEIAIDRTSTLSLHGAAGHNVNESHVS